MSLPTHIKLSDERKQRILNELVKLYHNEFDEELSAFQSERILEFFLKSLDAPGSEGHRRREGLRSPENGRSRRRVLRT